MDEREQFYLVDVLIRGGWVMVPLVLCSLVSLAIIIERLLWGPRRERVIPPEFVGEVRRLILAGRLEEAHGLCRATNLSVARVIDAAIRNVGKPRGQIVEAVELVGRREVVRLRRFLGILGTIVPISPLLGLLGTVSGMIHIFSVIQFEGVGNAAALAGGISEALITTVTGLGIAIITLVFYRFFLHQSQKALMDMEEVALNIVDELSQFEQSSNQISRVEAPPSKRMP